MRLRLNQEKDIAILDVLDDVSVQNVSVLRAGITKLLASGKHKIILNLIDAKQLAIEVIREIVKLHQVASELKGEIVLVGQGDMVKQGLKSFAAPPTIRYFSTREAALSALVEEKNKTAEPATRIEGPNSELRAHLEKLQAENKKLKEKIGKNNVDEIRKLRFENGVFSQQATALENQLKALLKERKPKADMETVALKITQLETALTGFLEKEGLVK